MPFQAKIDLFIDSQAAIDGVNNSIRTPASPRWWLKTNNNLLISNIIHRISTFHLSIKLHKIKGHFGNEYNEMADTLAKQVVCKAKIDPSLILNINDIQQEFCFSPKWNGVYIDHSLRKFIGIITKN